MSTVAPGINLTASSNPFQPDIGLAKGFVIVGPPSLTAAAPAPPSLFSAGGGGGEDDSTALFCATHWTRRILSGAYPAYTYDISVGFVSSISHNRRNALRMDAKEGGGAGGAGLSMLGFGTGNEVMRDVEARDSKNGT